LYLFDAIRRHWILGALFRAHEIACAKTHELISACGCQQGCPSCIGPAGTWRRARKKRLWPYSIGCVRNGNIHRQVLQNFRAEAERPRPSGAELLRAPHAEDSLSRFWVRDSDEWYGQHVLVRNWFSSPEQADMSEVSLELLSRGRDEQFPSAHAQL